MTVRTEGKLVNDFTSPPPEIICNQKGLDSCRVYSIIFPADLNILAGTDKGLFNSSDNGENWFYLNQDLSNSGVTCFCMQADSSILAGTSTKGIFISSESDFPCN